MKRSTVNVCIGALLIVSMVLLVTGFTIVVEFLEFGIMLVIWSVLLALSTAYWYERKMFELDCAEDNKSAGNERR